MDGREIISLSIFQLQRMMIGAGKTAVAVFVQENTNYKSKDLISQREAFRLFGRASVTNWTETHRLNIIRSGDGENSKKLYSKIELAALFEAEKIIKI